MANEKIYTVPLAKAYDYVRTKRTRRAVSLLKQFVSRHSKVELRNVRVSNALNSVLWARSIQKPPRKVKIKVVKEADIAKAYLMEEKIAKSEVKKEEKKDASKTASMPAAEAEKKHVAEKPTKQPKDQKEVKETERQEANVGKTANEQR